MPNIKDRQFDVITEANKSTLESIPPTLYVAENVPTMDSRVGFRCVGIPLASTLIVRRVDAVDGFGVPTSYTDFTRTTGVPVGTSYFVDEKFETGYILVDPTELGTQFEVQQEDLGTPFHKKIISEIESETIIQLAPITGRIRASNQQDRTWNAQTVALNAGIGQVRNLDIVGACHLRANVSASSGILEVFGNVTFAAGASLNLYKVLLIVHGNVIGDPGVPGIIKSPNGANGGDAGANGSDSILELSGVGGVGASGGGGGGGFGNGGGGGIFSSPGGNGGIGAGAGGSSFNLSSASGGGYSEADYSSSGGNAQSAPALNGGGGGAGATWIKFIIFGTISNITFLTGKGGVGGNGGVVGFGGQSGSIRAFFNRDLLTNVTFDVSPGTSTGNVTRDGTAGELHLHDIESGQKTTVWSPPNWLNSGNIATSLQGFFLNQEGYYTKAGAII